MHTPSFIKTLYFFKKRVKKTKKPIKLRKHEKENNRTVKKTN